MRPETSSVTYIVRQTLQSVAESRAKVRACEMSVTHASRLVDRALAKHAQTRAIVCQQRGHGA